MEVKRSFCCDIVTSNIGSLSKYRRVIYPDGTLSWQGQNLADWINVNDKISDKLEQQYQNLYNEQS